MDSTRSKRKNLSVDEDLELNRPSTSQKRTRLLKEQEILENLLTESEDNCSEFDDDVADPDFILESTHNTDSEQSDNDDDNQVENISETLSRSVYENTEDFTNNRQEGIEEVYCEGQEHERDERVVNNEERLREVSEAEQPRYYYGRNRFKWSSIEPTQTHRVRSHNIVHVPLQERTRQFTSVEQIWKSLITEDIIEIVEKYTNEKLEKYKAKFKDTARSELGPTNAIEIKAFIGLLFYSAVFRSNHENAEFIFATDGTGREVFRCVMSKNRFLILINCLRFDNAETRADRLRDDKLAAISEIFNAFINNCKRNFILGPHVCIDEILVGFRGRSNFKIYMPSKANKFGLKLLLLVDSQTFYTYNAYVYCGRGSDGEGLSDEEKRLSIPSQSVLRLCKGLEGSHRNITADNWFSSIELMKALQDRGLTYLGTLKKNKKEIPNEFQPHKDRIVGTSLYGFTKDYTMLSFVTKPKKAVILISSMHHGRGETTDKPIMIEDYNNTKGGGLAFY